MSATPRKQETVELVPFFNHVAEGTHQRDALRLGEPFILETLHELESVKVVITQHGGGRMEAPVPGEGEGEWGCSRDLGYWPHGR